VASELALGVTFSAAAGAALGAFGDLKDTLQGVNAVTKDLKARQAALGKEVQAAAKLSSSSVGQLSAQYEKQQKAIERLKQSSIALGKVQARLQEQEKKRAAMRTKMMETVAFAYGAVAPIKMAVDAETSYMEVMRTINGTQAEHNALQRDATQLLTKYPVALEEIHTLMQEVGQGGVGIANVSEFTELALQMRVGLGMTGEAAGQTATKLRNLYGIKTIERMRSMADTITYLANTGPAKSDQIIAVMETSATSFNALGIAERSAAGIASAFAGILQSPQDAAKAVDTLALRMSTAGKQGKGFQDALARIGLSSKALKKSIAQNGEAAITDLLERIAKAPKSAQAGLLLDLFGKGNAANMGMIVDNLDAYRETMARANDVTGAAGSLQQEFDERINTTGNLAKLTQNQLTELTLEIASGVLPAVRDLIREIRPLLERFSAWVRENPALFSTLLKIAAALAVFRLSSLLTGYAFSMLKTSVLGGYGAFVKFRAAYAMIKLGGLAAAFPNLTGGIGMLGKSIMWVSRLLMANPIILIIGGAIAVIAGAAFLIYKYWEQLPEIFSDIWKGFKTGFFSAISGISDLILNWSPLGLFYKVLADVMSYFGVELPGKFSDFGSQILQGMLGGIQRGAGAVIDGIQNVGKSMWNAVKETLGIHSPSKVFAEIGGFTMEGLADGLKTAAGLPLAAIKSTAGALAAAGSITLAGGAAPAIAAPGHSAGGGMASSIIINVYAAPGMDEKALADLVARKFSETQRTADSSRRARLYDAD